MSSSLHEKARDLVELEGWLLDQREWDAWLDLYAPDAVYWLPCWKDEYTLTSDPQREMSLIYYSNRSGLEDRIYRIRTERSLASTPLPRTCHMTSIGRVLDLPNGDIQVDSNWTVHNYKLAVAHCFFGQQTHVLRPTDGVLKIASRKVILHNDVIPNVLDVYSV